MHELITKNTYCPYCGESIELVLDTSIPAQEYIEDCEVCCRPITISVQCDTEGSINLSTRSENE